MYVCICHAVTDKAIKKAAESGVTTIDELKLATGCASGCGSCVNEALSILIENQEQKTPAFLSVKQQLGLAS